MIYTNEKELRTAARELGKGYTLEELDNKILELRKPKPKRRKRKKKING